MGRRRVTRVPGRQRSGCPGARGGPRRSPGLPSGRCLSPEPAGGSPIDRV